jgi:uncharacterized cupin superfamily protein
VEKTFNIFAAEQDWDTENDRDGYRHRVTAIGKRLDASMLGGSLYELPPGESAWPYHYEYESEEWLFVVTGKLWLRDPDGERELRAGEVVVFPPGPAGAHRVENRSDEDVRLIFFSTKSPLEVVAYPDSGKLGIWTREHGYVAMLRDEPKLDYWDGE